MYFYSYFGDQVFSNYNFYKKLMGIFTYNYNTINMNLCQLIIIIILWISINSAIIYFFIDANEKDLDKKIFSEEKVIQFVSSRKTCDLYYNQTIHDSNLLCGYCFKDIDDFIIRVDNYIFHTEYWITISECLSNIPVEGLQILVSEKGDFFPCDSSTGSYAITYIVLGIPINLIILSFFICSYTISKHDREEESVIEQKNKQKSVIEQKLNYICLKNIKNSTNENNTESCPICLEEFEEDNIVINLTCNHNFHVNCWNKYQGKNCPMCRRSIEYGTSLP